VCLVEDWGRIEWIYSNFLDFCVCLIEELRGIERLHFYFFQCLVFMEESRAAPVVYK
jgi:hypothetical protein